MSIIYKVNTEIDVPIYQQLVDIIESAIKRVSLLTANVCPPSRK